MHILITNDDGYQAKGIHELTRVMRRLGQVTVVAPDGPRSAQSNALTVLTPIRLNKIKEEEGLTIYSCSGTPTDCIKLALHELFKGSKPDLLVSGINHGSNASINVIYSGTMGAVLEGCEQGIPSIGFSLCDYQADADFSHFTKHIEGITKTLLECTMPYGTCFNINAPKGEIKGIRKARQCRGDWSNDFKKNFDQRESPYYWLTGDYTNHEPQAEDTDEWALEHGYISVVPTKIDLTDYDCLSGLTL